MSRLVLGLDIGEASVGGALLRLNDEDELQEILWTNSRVFSGVVDSKNKTTLNAQRRSFRGQRRTINRRARRRKRVEHALVKIGLLPEDPEERARVLGRNNPSVPGGDPFLNPYALRARAISERLDPFEIGRALQHILQRRGFRSNRKAKLADLLGSKSEFRNDDELQRWIAETQESLDVGEEDSVEDVRPFKPNQAKSESDEDGLGGIAEEGEKEDPRKTLEAIERLEQRMRASGLPTIGAYLASRLEAGEKVRKRNRILRTWLEEEFDRIWEFQSQFYPDLLTEEAKQELRSAFEQRPLKPFRMYLPKRGFTDEHPDYFARMTRACGLFGHVKPVARKGHWMFHRFRILETLRNLRLRTEEDERPLEPKEYMSLAKKLQGTASMSWAQIRKEIGAPNGSKFTIEDSKGSPTKLAGNITEIKLKRILGDKWDDSLELPEDVERDQLEFMQDLETMNDVSKPAVVKLFRLLQRPKANGNRIYPLTKRQAYDLLCETFSSQTGNYSVRAMRELHRAMRNGISPYHARTYFHHLRAMSDEQQCVVAAGLAKPPEGEGKLFQDLTRQAGKKLDRLPVPPPLRNPRVQRALYEIRKVVNGLIERYGMPDLIRIELVRELRENKKQREERAKAIKENERKNAEAKAWYAEQPSARANDVTRKDILKHRLWVQQQQTCPYCLKGIGANEILEDIAEIDHVVPITRGGMDSFSNKVIAHATCNAEKGDRLPWEVWGHDDQAWSERIKSIKRTENKALCKNFERKEVPEDFVERQLSDTSYIGKECVKYLDQLNLKGIRWGRGPWPRDVPVPPGVHLDENGMATVTVWPTNGSATAFLRRVWELDSILPNGVTDEKAGKTQKQRLDHRHHALDAIVVAMTNPRRYRAALEAYRGKKERREKAKLVFYKPPREEVKKKLDVALTSHAVNKGIRGALHDAMFYGRKELGGEVLYVRRIGVGDLLRPNAAKPNHAETKRFVEERVYDQDLRRALLQRLDMNDWERAFKSPPLVLLDKKGNPMRVETVRVRHRKRTDDSTLNIDHQGSKDPRDRYVAPESNHHAEVVRLPNGTLKHRVVRMIEAARAMRSKKSPYGLTVEPGERLVLCLGMDEIVEYDGNPMRVASVAMAGIFLRDPNDARSANDEDRTFVAGHAKLSLLRRKFACDPLGKLTPYDGP